MINRLLLGCALLGCAAPALAADRATIDALVEQHAAMHGVPVSLVHRVIRRESNYNARASSRGNFGLMQIRHATARGMGYRGGAAGLLDARTNLTYAVPYLANAYRVAGGNADRAVSLYSRGYYYEAKRKGLAGRLQTAAVEPETVEVAPTPAPVEPPSLLAALFGSPQPAVEAAPVVASPETVAEETATVEAPRRRVRTAKRRLTVVERREARAARRAAAAEARVAVEP